MLTEKRRHRAELLLKWRCWWVVGDPSDEGVRSELEDDDLKITFWVLSLLYSSCIAGDVMIRLGNIGIGGKEIRLGSIVAGGGEFVPSDANASYPEH